MTRRALKNIPAYHVAEQRNIIISSGTILTLLDMSDLVWLLETPSGVQILIRERWWPWLAPIKKGED